MRYQRFDNRLQVRLASGDHAHDGLMAVLMRENVQYATLTGLGAARWVKLAYWDAATREYQAHEIEEQVEVVSLIGNVSLREGEPFLHWHISLGRRDLSLFGGHFLDAVVNPNLEIWLQLEDRPIRRVMDAASGLALMDLPEHE